MSKTPMTMERARQLVGNQSKFFLRKMVQALKMCPLLNTEADEERLEAALFILRNK